MQLHELKSTIKRKKRKFVGRGGKRGTTSGKGTKGQRARSGHRIRPAERDLLLKFPKLKGIKHKPVSLKNFVCNVGDLEKMFKEEKKLSKKVFIEKGYITKKGQGVKILSEGSITRAFFLQGIECSKKAKEKIERAGGIIE